MFSTVQKKKGNEGWTEPKTINNNNNNIYYDNKTAEVVLIVVK